MASRTDCFIEGKFFTQVNPKDGFAVSDCKEAKARRVLEFLVSLLYPEKPTRVTITGKTLSLGLYLGSIDWRAVIKDVVQRLYSGMGKSKATPSIPIFSICITQMSAFFKARRKIIGSWRPY